MTHSLLFLSIWPCRSTFEQRYRPFCPAGKCQSTRNSRATTNTTSCSDRSRPTSPRSTTSSSRTSASMDSTSSSPPPHTPPTLPLTRPASPPSTSAPPGLSSPTSRTHTSPPRSPRDIIHQVLHRLQAVARRTQALRRLRQRTGDLLPGIRRQRVVHSGRRPQRHHHHQEPIRVHLVQERVNHGQQRLRCLRRPRRDR